MRREGEQDRGIGTAETVTLPDAGPAPERPTVERLGTGAMVDRFVILERLGEGGMGVVYSAFDPQLDRKVALKFLRREVADEERLLREAQAMARLSHPNVVQVFEMGTFHGRVFVAMEFVDGATLKGWLRDKPRSWAELWPVMRGAAHGLAAAHQAGIVHRDFKPDNVLVDRDGRAKVTDFGLARSSEGQGSSSDAGATSLSEPLTRTGAVVGTPMYMAPEQHLGEKTDAATDQFAFCVTLYEALHGARPFAGDTVPALAEAVTSGRIEPQPKQPAVPRWRREIVVRGLARRPADRHASMDALVAALDRDPSAVRRRAIAAVAALLVVGAAVALLWLRSGRSESTVCKGARDRLAGVWDEDRAAQLRAAFGAIGKPYAVDAADRVIARLDRRAGDWAAMRTEACEATHVSGEQSDTLLDLRMRCLDRRIVELDAIATLLADSPNEEVVRESLQLESAVPGLEACADARALMAEVPPPDDPAMRRLHDDLRDRIVREVEPRINVATVDARKALDTMSAQVSAVPSPSLHAVFAYNAGRVAYALGDVREASKQLEIAIREASAARDFRMSANAWTRRVQYELADGTVPAAEELLVGARASVAALGSAPIEDAQLLVAEAGVLDTRGDFAGAVAMLERAHQLQAAALGADHLTTLSTETEIAEGILKTKDVKGARRRLETVEAKLERALGPHHPELMGNLATLAIALRTEGDYAAAMRQANRAEAIARASYGPDHLNVARVLEVKGSICARQGDNACSVEAQRQSVRIRRAGLRAPNRDLGSALLALANALKTAGELAEARKAFEEAIGVFETSVGKQHPESAMAVYGYGNLLALMGEQDAAVTQLRRAVDVMERAQGSNHRLLGAVLGGLANALLGKGDPAGAVPVAQRAVEIASASGGEPMVLVMANINLGRALFESGQDRRRGKELMLSARKDLVAIGPGVQGQVRLLDDWLKAHGVRQP